MAIYDTMQSLQSPVGTHCVGYAYNLAGFLLAAGEKVKLLPHNGKLTSEKNITGRKLIFDTMQGSMINHFIINGKQITYPINSKILCSGFSLSSCFIQNHMIDAVV